MSFVVRLSRKAQADVDVALAWIANQRSQQQAEGWYRRLLLAFDLLGTSPDRQPISGDSVELGVELREMTFGRRRFMYRIFFRIREADVYVVRIRHGRQDRLRPDDL